MKLRYLTLESSNEIKLSQNYIPFNWTIHHVKEIYLKLFPKTIELNNSNKIAIVYGPRGNEPVFDGVLGVTNYFVEGFNFEIFYKANKTEQENIILESINNVIIEIYKRTGKNKEIINEIINTANIIKEIKFNMEIEIKKLSKITLDKKYKIYIYRILNNEVGEGWKYIKMNRKTKNIEEENWINKIPNYLDKTDYYKKAEINEKEYILYNNLGKTVNKITI